MTPVYGVHGRDVSDGGHLFDGDGRYKRLIASRDSGDFFPVGSQPLAPFLVIRHPFSNEIPE